MLLATSTTAVDGFVFVVASAIVLLSALGVVLARNPVHSALMLVLTLFGVAVLFVAQQAHFLAAVQVIVYAGAIVVLFLFVIMLLGVDKTELDEATNWIGGLDRIHRARGILTCYDLSATPFVPTGRRFSLPRKTRSVQDSAAQVTWATGQKTLAESENRLKNSCFSSRSRELKC